MIVLIALLVGIYDVWALAGIFVMNAAMCWFGWMMEVHNQYTEALMEYSIQRTLLIPFIKSALYLL